MTGKEITDYTSEAKEQKLAKFDTQKDKNNTINECQWQNHDSYTTNTH